LASHAHYVEWSSSDYGSGTSTSVTSGSSEYETDTSVKTTEAGNDEAHENRPPFFALAYIMKV